MGAGALQPALLLLAEALLPHLCCRCKQTPCTGIMTPVVVCNAAPSFNAGLSGRTELCCAAGGRNLPKCCRGQNKPKAQPARSVRSSRLLFLCFWEPDYELHDWNCNMRRCCVCKDQQTVLVLIKSTGLLLRGKRLYINNTSMLSLHLQHLLVAMVAWQRQQCQRTLKY